ncbi:MAG: CorA family divalent cation transporter [Bdellovibrionota bacterium]
MVQAILMGDCNKAEAEKSNLQLQTKEIVTPDTVQQQDVCLLDIDVKLPAFKIVGPGRVAKRLNKKRHSCRNVKLDIDPKKCEVTLYLFDPEHQKLILAVNIRISTKTFDDATTLFRKLKIKALKLLQNNKEGVISDRLLSKFFGKTLPEISKSFPKGSLQVVSKLLVNLEVDEAKEYSATVEKLKKLQLEAELAGHDRLVYFNPKHSTALFSSKDGKLAEIQKKVGESTLPRDPKQVRTYVFNGIRVSDILKSFRIHNIPESPITEFLEDRGSREDVEAKKEHMYFAVPLFQVHKDRPGEFESCRIHIMAGKNHKNEHFLVVINPASQENFNVCFDKVVQENIIPNNGTPAYVTATLRILEYIFERNADAVRALTHSVDEAQTKLLKCKTEKDVKKVTHQTPLYHARSRIKAKQGIPKRILKGVVSHLNQNEMPEAAKAISVYAADRLEDFENETETALATLKDLVDAIKKKQEDVIREEEKGKTLFKRIVQSGLLAAGTYAAILTGNLTGVATTWAVIVGAGLLAKYIKQKYEKRPRWSE